MRMINKYQELFHCKFNSSINGAIYGKLTFVLTLWPVLWKGQIRVDNVFRSPCRVFDVLNFLGCLALDFDCRPAKANLSTVLCLVQCSDAMNGPVFDTEGRCFRAWLTVSVVFCHVDFAGFVTVGSRLVVGADRAFAGQNRKNKKSSCQ
jgi:hypothetical protein